MEYIAESTKEDKTYDKLYEDYLEYCKTDGKRLYHLPFIIWLKHVAKIKLDN